MSEVLIPPWIIPEDEPQEPLDEGSSVFRAAFAPGIAQRQSYGGLRLKLSRRHTVRLEEKAQLLAALRATRGSYNVLRTKVHFALRGSFSATELLSNHTFANGTTGWNADSPSGYANSVADRVYRATRVANGASVRLIRNAATVTCVQYAPYVMRVVVMAGPGAQANLRLGLGSTAGGAEYGASSSVEVGYRTFAAVPDSTTISARVTDHSSSGFSTGDYYEIPWISLSRCALVDNAPNAFTRSDEIDNAAWTKTNCTATANSYLAPFGLTLGERITEDTSNAEHYFFHATGATKPAAAEDWCVAGSFRRGDNANQRDRIKLSVNAGGGQDGFAFFDLTAGTIISTGTNGTFANVRAFISSLGADWYYCAVLARTGTQTGVNGTVALVSSGTTTSYTGDGLSNIGAWRMVLAKSSVPVRLTQTTTAGSSGSSQTGSALYLKGLSASTNGLLLPEDIFEINGEIKTCIAALNSDAAGLGYLQFEPPLVRSPADNDPVIITDPMGKFLVSNIKIDNEFGTQARVSYDLEHIYE